MLTRLHISNYALIDELEIKFDNGLTIITGETGAGKSIILGALSLILGERADARSVRNPEKKVVVEASFDISAYALEGFFAENEIDFWEEECIVRREISATGRSRAFVNDTPVTISVLKDLTSRLVDIHSQQRHSLCVLYTCFSLDLPHFACCYVYLVDIIPDNYQMSRVHHDSSFPTNISRHGNISIP